MAATPNETSLDMNINPGISSLTRGRGTSTPTDCLPICIQIQSPRPPSANSPQNLGKIILSITFQTTFFSSPTSSPSLPVLFRAAMLIGFALSFAGVFLQNAFPRIALLLQKLGALFAAIGFFIISSVLVPNLAWICWLACGFCLLAFIISFK